VCIRADYNNSFRPTSQAEIFKDKILLKHSKRLQNKNFSPGWVSAQLKLSLAENVITVDQAENRHVTTGNFSPGRTNNTIFSFVCGNTT
jgi:hypothetical protein